MLPVPWSGFSKFQVPAQVPLTFTAGAAISGVDGALTQPPARTTRTPMRSGAACLIGQLPYLVHRRRSWRSSGRNRLDAWDHVAPRIHALLVREVVLPLITRGGLMESPFPAAPVVLLELLER